MSTDADYAAFLDKANQDVSSGPAKTQSMSKSLGIKGANVNSAAVPKRLEEVDVFLVSESDEPFEPLSLEYDGGKLPSSGTMGVLSSLSSCFLGAG